MAYRDNHSQIEGHSIYTLYIYRDDAYYHIFSNFTKFTKSIKESAHIVLSFNARNLISNRRRNTRFPWGLTSRSLFLLSIYLKI